MDLNQLKDFILWCKKHKVKHYKSESQEFELSELAFVEEYNVTDLSAEPIKEIRLDSTTPIVDSEEPPSKEEEDEDLYWSVK